MFLGGRILQQTVLADSTSRGRQTVTLVGWGDLVFSETWLAIHREASLAAEHLASGATLLGKANYAQQSYYYQAFFALSVGFERSAKLALAVDKYLQDGHFPTESELRDFGHKLDALLAEMDSLARRRGLTGDWATLPNSAIHVGIISVLSDFASNVTRYYNLDLLTRAPRLRGVTDPLMSWHEKVFVPVSEIHYTAKCRAKVEANAQLVEELMGGHALVRHVSETGDPLTDVSAASALTGMTEAVQPYVRMYVLQIARFIDSVMSDLGNASMQQSCEDIPYLSDYFSIFCNDDALFKGRKNWSIHGMR